MHVVLTNDEMLKALSKAFGADVTSYRVRATGYIYIVDLTQKIQTIKAVRSVKAGLGLSAAKDLVDRFATGGLMLPGQVTDEPITEEQAKLILDSVYKDMTFVAERGLKWMEPEEADLLRARSAVVA